MKNPCILVHLTLPKSQPSTIINNINMNHWHDFTTVSRHTWNCLLLGRASLFPATPRIASYLTTCHLVALFSYHSIILRTMFTLIYFSLHSLLHFIKHGIYGPPTEESLCTEGSRSTPWEGSCTCIQEDSQSWLLIKWLNAQPSNRV